MDDITANVFGKLLRNFMRFDKRLDLYVIKETIFQREIKIYIESV